MQLSRIAAPPLEWTLTFALTFSILLAVFFHDARGSIRDRVRVHSGCGSLLWIDPGIVRCRECNGRYSELQKSCAGDGVWAISRVVSVSENTERVFVSLSMHSVTRYFASFSQSPSLRATSSCRSGVSQSFTVYSILSHTSCFCTENIFLYFLHHIKKHFEHLDTLNYVLIFVENLVFLRFIS